MPGPFTWSQMGQGLRQAVVDPVRDDFKQATEYFKQNYPLPYAAVGASPLGPALGAAEVVGGNPGGLVQMVPGLRAGYQIGNAIPATFAAATRAGGSGLRRQLANFARQLSSSQNTAEIGEGAYDQFQGQ